MDARIKAGHDEGECWRSHHHVMAGPRITVRG